MAKQKKNNALRAKVDNIYVQRIGYKENGVKKQSVMRALRLLDVRERPHATPVYRFKVIVSSPWHFPETGSQEMNVYLHQLWQAHLSSKNPMDIVEGDDIIMESHKCMENWSCGEEGGVYERWATE